LAGGRLFPVANDKANLLHVKDGYERQLPGKPPIIVRIGVSG
jgi:hypothetical protein